MMFRWAYWNKFTSSADAYDTGAHIDSGPAASATNQPVLRGNCLISPKTILDLWLSWTRSRYGQTPEA